MFRSLLFILSGNLTNAVLLMVRNILIARMMSLEDFGIASTFMLAMLLVEMVSDLGLHQQIVQARNGDDSRLQAALQGFQFLRGLTNGIFLFLIGGWIADFFDQEQAAWTYRLLALVPAINGLVHFDIYRKSRQLNYLPILLTSALPPLISVLLLPGMVMLLPDYRVMLCAMVVQSTAWVILSHLVAERPYRMALDRAIIRGSLRFGWPLLTNGLLMFLIFNGERMIVGRELGMTALALFGMAFSLVLSPTLVLAKSAMSFFLPQLSASKEPSAFRHMSMTVFEVHFLLGSLLVLCVALLGGPFIHFALGERYADAIPLLTWVAIMQAVRLMKGGSSAVALSRAYTGNAMAANLVRVALLPVAWVVAVSGGDLRAVIWIGIAGELVGLVVGLALAFWRLPELPKRALVLPFLSSMAMMFIGAIHAISQHNAQDWIPDPAIAGLLSLVFIAGLLTMRDLVDYIRRRQMVRHQD